jgi:hypothetical protein
MRPRFSLKCLLVLFIVLAAVFYSLVVRPTALATSLIADARQGNYTAVTTLVPNDELLQNGNRTWKVSDARLQARDWMDLLHCQRRFSILLAREPPFVNSTALEITAGPTGYFVDKVIQGQIRLE